MPRPSPHIQFEPAAFACCDGRGLRRAIILLAYVTFAIGRTNPLMAATGPETYSSAALARVDHWQRIELPPGQCPAATTSQMTVVIETKGPRLSGRIRIPGGIASNFETAEGKAVVELINVGNSQTGFAAITAAEIYFTEASAEQSFTTTAIDCQAK